MIKMDDLSSACKSAQVFLFADDTNISSLGSNFSKIYLGIDNLDDWFSVNKLAFNINRTFQLVSSINKNRACPIFEIVGVALKRAPNCKYLGNLMTQNIIPNTHQHFS